MRLPTDAERLMLIRILAARMIFTIDNAVFPRPHSVRIKLDRNATYRIAHEQ